MWLDHDRLWLPCCEGEQCATPSTAPHLLLCAQVVEVARSFVEVWEGVTALLSELDVLAGFADLAANAPDPYARPEVCVWGRGRSCDDLLGLRPGAPLAPWPS